MEHHFYCVFTQNIPERIVLKEALAGMKSQGKKCSLEKLIQICRCPSVPEAQVLFIYLFFKCFKTSINGVNKIHLWNSIMAAGSCACCLWYFCILFI